MSDIQVGGSLTPGSVDTPLDARARISAISGVPEIRLPYIGMVFYVTGSGKRYVVKSLKSRQIGQIVVERAQIDQYEELAAITLAELDERYPVLAGGRVKEEQLPEGMSLAELDERYAAAEPGEPGEPAAKAKPSKFNLPVPYDPNNDNVSLLLDIATDPAFPEGGYTRITMAEWHAKMTVFQDGVFVPVTDTSVGKPHYGANVAFTLDEEMFPGYVAGDAYFARYTWLDSAGGRSDWKGLEFSGDVIEMEPIIVPYVTPPRTKTRTIGPGGDHVFDYLDAEIFNVTPLAFGQEYKLKLDNMKNVPFGEAMIITVDMTGKSGTLMVEFGSSRSQTYTEEKVYIIAVTNFGTKQIAVTETV